MPISTDFASVEMENHRKYTDCPAIESVFFFVFDFYTDHLSVYFMIFVISTDYLSVFFYDFAKSTDSRYSESVFFGVMPISTDFASVEMENHRKYTDCPANQIGRFRRYKLRFPTWRDSSRILIRQKHFRFLRLCILMLSRRFLLFRKDKENKYSLYFSFMT